MTDLLAVERRVQHERLRAAHADWIDFMNACPGFIKLLRVCGGIVAEMGLALEASPNPS